MKELKDLKLQEISKLKELSDADLKKELVASEKKYFTLNMKLKLGELKQTHLIKALRRYIARVKTIANSKSLDIG